jgi:hypothetical protein
MMARRSDRQPSLKLQPDKKMHAAQYSVVTFFGFSQTSKLHTYQ